MGSPCLVPCSFGGGLPPGGSQSGGSAGATHPTRIHTCLETVTVALKYSEKDLRGVPLYFIFKGSVQGNFQRYEFLKKKFLQRRYSVTKRRTRTRRSRSRVTCATRSSPDWSIYTTTTMTQFSPRTSSSAPTARNHSCLRVVSIV